MELENPDSEATKLIRVEIQKALDEDRSEAGSRLVAILPIHTESRGVERNFRLTPCVG